MKIGYFIGPAGSGKSHMTGALYSWMNQVEMEVITVNLDPAVVRLPYSPMIDIRQFISYDEMVDKFELGPNGAIIATMDQVALRIEEVIAELKEFDSEYVLIDLPGQLETFAYRASGPLILNEIGKENKMAGVFLVDPILCTTASSFISVLMLGSSIRYRLNTALRFVISKGDTISPERTQQIDDWMEYPDFILDALRSEPGILNADLSLRIADILLQEEVYGNFPIISSQTNANIDLAYGELQRIWDTEDLFS